MSQSSLDRQQASFASSMAAAAKLSAGGVGGGGGTSSATSTPGGTGSLGKTRALAPPSPSPSVGSTTSAAVTAAGTTGGGTPRKDRHDTPGLVYSQPANTSTGESMIAQLTYAVKWLRDKGEPQTYDSISRFLSMGNRSERDHELFVNQIRQSSSVEWVPDPSLSEQTWKSGTYRHRAVIPDVRAKDDLLRYLQRKPDASGVSVKDLKDGWPDCERAVDELEAAHQLLVVRQKKDGAAKMVWPDDPSLFRAVDPEFKALWAKVEVPGIDTIVQRLNSVNQKAASEDPRLKLANQPKVEKKKKRQARRTTKMTNAHMEDKFKDFSHMKR